VDRITVSAQLADGRTRDFDVEPDFLQRLYALQLGGIQGKELIHALLTDDWTTPPVLVTVSGIAPDGERVDINIRYE